MATSKAMPHRFELSPNTETLSFPIAAPRHRTAVPASRRCIHQLPMIDAAAAMASQNTHHPLLSAPPSRDPPTI